jgi:hypothetical protein
LFAFDAKQLGIKQLGLEEFPFLIVIAAAMGLLGQGQIERKEGGRKKPHQTPKAIHEIFFYLGRSPLLVSD